MDEKNGSISEALLKSGLHSGHRKRIYERAKRDGLCSHELLELLLFNALPRRNTNDLAHLLLAEFGDLWGVLTAPIEQLCRVPGIGESVACYLGTIGKILQAHEAQESTAHPTHFEMESFSRFMYKEYDKLGCEVLDIYVLDGTGKIYGRKRCSSLRAKKVEVQFRWLMNILLDFNPAGIVLVHNHPHGKSSPSQTDDFTTEECRSLCEKNGVIFCDHLIYSRSGIYSYNLGKQIRLQEGEGEFEKVYD